MISEQTEIDVLLYSVNQAYGYDLSGYSETFTRRRLRDFKQKHGYKRLSDVLPRMLQDSDFFYDMLRDYSIPYTEIFRDPDVYSALRHVISTHLKSYPKIKVWSAGCATGEEAYSLAILLHEEGLLDKSMIYATDINYTILNAAKLGVFGKEKLEEAAKNHTNSGGKGSIYQYFDPIEDNWRAKEFLKDKITFAHHNIVADSTFGEVHLVMFRNVMIYFDDNFQSKALETICDSLCHLGIMVIGDKEVVSDNIADRLTTLSRDLRIFQKTQG